MNINTATANSICEKLFDKHFYVRVAKSSQEVEMGKYAFGLFGNTGYKTVFDCLCGIVSVHLNDEYYEPELDKLSKKEREIYDAAVIRVNSYPGVYPV